MEQRFTPLHGRFVLAPTSIHYITKGISFAFKSILTLRFLARTRPTLLPNRHTDAAIFDYGYRREVPAVFACHFFLLDTWMCVLRLQMFVVATKCPFAVIKVPLWCSSDVCFKEFFTIGRWKNICWCFDITLQDQIRISLNYTVQDSLLGSIALVLPSTLG